MVLKIVLVCCPESSFVCLHVVMIHVVDSSQLVMVHCLYAPSSKKMCSLYCRYRDRIRDKWVEIQCSTN